MKRWLVLLFMALCCSLSFAEVPCGKLWGTTIEGISWTFQITDEGTALVGGGNQATVPYATSYTIAGDLVIPAYFMDCPTVYIDWCAFSGFKKITSVEIPDTVSEITTSAFSGCEKLATIKWPTGLKKIGGNAFYQCTSLRSVVLPSCVEEVGQLSFGYCTSLSKIELPDSLKYIRTAAFRGCQRLADLPLPDSVVIIQDFAFADCTGLSTICIPASTEYVKRGICAGATNVVSFSVSPNNQYYVAVKGSLYNKEITRIVAYPPILEDFDVEPSVTCIGEGACYRGTRLRAIHLPEGLTKIESSAFRGCSGVTSLVIPSRVQTIGTDAFYACSSLKSIVFPRSVESVGSDAFQSCQIEVVFVEQGDVERAKSVLKNSKIGIDKVQFVELPSLATSMSWTEEYYKRFSDKYDPNIQTAMMMPSGKRSAAGEEMQVLQDFIAGTDPLRKDDVFSATVDIVDGQPVVSWTPKLASAESEKRTYTVWGKKSLVSDKWTVVDGDASAYQFFMVSVEMR